MNLSTLVIGYNHIEESIMSNVTKNVEMTDEAIAMTDLLYPLIEKHPNWYYKMLNLSLMSGCIIGDA